MEADFEDFEAVAVQSGEREREVSWGFGERWMGCSEEESETNGLETRIPTGGG